MVSALEASLESPQIPPEARDRIRPLLGLWGAAAKAMGEMRADVFVRRLIERIGFRRHRLFAAHPETAERLRSLSRLGKLAADWTRREPGGSTRDFVRYLVAVSEAGSPRRTSRARRWRARSGDAQLESLKGLEFARLYVVGMQAGAPGPSRIPAAPPELAGGGAPFEAERRRLLYMAMTRASEGLVLAAATGQPRRARPALALLRGGPSGARRGEEEHARSSSDRPRACRPPTG